MPAALNQASTAQARGINPEGCASTSIIYGHDSGLQQNSVTMSYGAYSISPVPLITINKQFNKTADGRSVGTTFQLTMEGTVAAVNAPGIVNTMAIERDIREAFDSDGKYFVIKCNEDIVLECYPRVLSLNFNPSNDNWVYTIPYSITIEYENEPIGNIGGYGSGENVTNLMPPFIKQYDENWQVEFLGERSKYSINTVAGLDESPYEMRLTHNVSAAGIRHYSGSGQLIGNLDQEGWKQARSFIEDKLGFDEEKFVSNVGLNLSPGIWDAYDHARVNNLSETDGTYSISESWLVLSNNITSPRAAIEDFTVDINDSIEQEFSSVAIQGTIRGLESIDYGTTSGDFSINTTRYNAASGYWSSIKSSLLYGRVANVAGQEGFTLNTVPQTKIVGHSPSQGTITYNYNYNTRPSNCISNARYENVTIVDNYPTDVFASVQVLGRAQGPILQSMNTVTEFQRSVSIELLMTGAGGCSYLDFVSGTNPDQQVNSLILCPIYSGLIAMYDTVYKTQDQVSWSPRTGRYSRNVSWSATDCDISPDTSAFC